MWLTPSEAIDGAFLFYPHLYDREEIGFLEANLRPGDVFVDAGAHIGFYSLMAARVVGPSGRVIAIEPQASTFDRLRWNISANHLPQVTPVRIGVSDRCERRLLGLNLEGNLGGSSFGEADRDTEEVQCEPLLMVLEKLGVTSVAGLKLDIEGDELRVLQPFLESAGGDLLPRFVIVEDELGAAEADNPLLDLLGDYGFRPRSKHFGNALNWVLERDR